MHWLPNDPNWVAAEAAIAAALAGITAAAISFLTFREQRASRVLANFGRPPELELYAVREKEGRFAYLTIWVRNFYPTRLELERCEIHKPRSALLLDPYDRRLKRDNGLDNRSIPDRQFASKQIDIGLSLASAGTTRDRSDRFASASPTDRERTQCILFVEADKQAEVSLRLHFRRRGSRDKLFVVNARCEVEIER